MNYDEWNRYHVVAEAVRHGDVSAGDTPNNGEHLKNRAYYFEQVEGSELGRLWMLPWDSDTSWGAELERRRRLVQERYLAYAGRIHAARLRTRLPEHGTGNSGI